MSDNQEWKAEDFGKETELYKLTRAFSDFDENLNCFLVVEPDEAGREKDE